MWLDIYEVFTVLLMQYVLFNYNYCEGTAQFFICLFVNTMVYWALLLSTIYFSLRAHCTYVSREEAEKFLHGDEKHKD